MAFAATIDRFGDGRSENHVGTARRARLVARTRWVRIRRTERLRADATLWVRYPNGDHRICRITSRRGVGVG